MSYKAFYLGYAQAGSAFFINTWLADSTGAANVGVNIPLSISFTDTAASLLAAVPGVVSAYCSTNFGFTPVSDEWVFNPTITIPNKAFSYPTRALNTAYQPSTTRDTLVFLSISMSCALSLTTGQSGQSILEIADDAAFTTNVRTLATVSNSSTGTLVIGLNTVNGQGAVVSGVVPAAKYYRTRIVNVTGTPTSTAVGAAEVQF